MGKASEDLRALADAQGIVHTHGYQMGRGEDAHRIMEDRVTTLWPSPDDAVRSITIEEDEDGRLWLEDDVTIEQAIAIAMVERARARMEAEA